MLLERMSTPVSSPRQGAGTGLKCSLVPTLQICASMQAQSEFKSSRKAGKWINLINIQQQGLRDIER